MDKKKLSSQQPTKWRILNWILIITIVGISASLILNYITPDHTMSVEGTWTGIITDDYGEFIVFDYTVTITQNNDKQFSGSTFAQAQPEFRDVHAGTHFVGFIQDKDTITFEDVSIKNANTGWCRIETTLERSNHNGVEVLAGKWYGIGSPSCIGLDGRIHLTKAY